MSLYFLQGYSGTCIVWSWNSFCQRIGVASLIACWLSNTQWKRRWSVAEEYSMSWSWKCAGDRSYDGKCSPCVPAQHTRHQGSLLLSHALWETLPSSQYFWLFITSFELWWSWDWTFSLICNLDVLSWAERLPVLGWGKPHLSFQLLMYACAQSLGHRTVIQVSCTEMRWSYKYVDEAVPVLIWIMHSKVGTWSILSYLRPVHCIFWACW